MEYYEIMGNGSYSGGVNGWLHYVLTPAAYSNFRSSPERLINGSGSNLVKVNKEFHPPEFQNTALLPRQIHQLQSSYLQLHLR